VIAFQAGATDTAHIVIVASTTCTAGSSLDYVRDAAAPGGLARAATGARNAPQPLSRPTRAGRAGDLLQGNPFATFYGATKSAAPPIVDALNALQYDVVNRATTTSTSASISCAVPPRRPRIATSRRTSKTQEARRCSRRR